MLGIEIQSISTAHPLYVLERDLRFRVLREPLGDERGSEAFEFEDQSVHVVAVLNGAVVGCVLFFPDDSGSGRLFQMAVGPEHQGTGLGRKLVQHLEALLIQEGVSEVSMHAREEAVGFYERLGYECYGAAFEEVGVPHRHMRRRL